MKCSNSRPTVGYPTSAALFERCSQEAVKVAKMRPDGQRDGFLVLTLTMSEDSWFVIDFDFESKEGAEGEWKRFLEANPNAVGLTPVRVSQVRKVLEASWNAFQRQANCQTA